jgi:DNA mismatch endonuclease (patch repair protein)
MPSTDDGTAPEPDRVSPGGALSAKMSGLARQDTAPELGLRRALHALGLRYRLQVRVPGNNRRRIDIAFTRARVAVFVDGCYWHGCPDHGTRPKANREWWDWKIARNKARDADTNLLLTSQGWMVVRVWEHDDPSTAADRISVIVRDR